MVISFVGPMTSSVQSWSVPEGGAVQKSLPLILILSPGAVLPQGSRSTVKQTMPPFSPDLPKLTKGFPKESPTPLTVPVNSIS